MEGVKLRIIFDPNHGKAVPDGQVQTFVLTQVLDFLDISRRGESKEVRIGSRFMLDLFRFFILIGYLPYQAVEVQYGKETLCFNEFANLQGDFEVPSACDHDSFISQILKLQIKKRKEAHKE